MKLVVTFAECGLSLIRFPSQNSTNKQKENQLRLSSYYSSVFSSSELSSFTSSVASGATGVSSIMISIAMLIMCKVDLSHTLLSYRLPY